MTEASSVDLRCEVWIDPPPMVPGYVEDNSFQCHSSAVIVYCVRVEEPDPQNANGIVAHTEWVPMCMDHALGFVTSVRGAEAIQEIVYPDDEVMQVKKVRTKHQEDHWTSNL